MVAEVPDECLFQLGTLGAHPGSGHLGQDLGVAFTTDQAAIMSRPETYAQSTAGFTAYARLVGQVSTRTIGYAFAANTAPASSSSCRRCGRGPG